MTRPATAPSTIVALAVAATLLLALAGCHAVDSVSPNPAEAGDTIVIRGSGFGADQGNGRVLYDGDVLAVTSWAASRIDAVLPAAKPNGVYILQVEVKGELSNALTHELDTPSFAMHIADGTVTYVEGTECPPGWVELTDAAGRLIVGRTDGTTVGALVGDPLAEGEDPTHTHDYATTVRTSGAGIIGATGCCNSSLGDNDTYDVTGTTQAGDAALPRIQQLVCERDVATPPAHVDDHPYPVNTVMFFDRQSCPDGFTLMGEADGRFIVPTPAGGDVGARVGVSLENREDRQHTHRLSASIQVPQSSMAALGGLNFDHTAKGTYDFNGTTFEASSGMPYMQLLVCKATFRLPPPGNLPITGDVVPPGSFAFFDALACPSGWTRSGAHEGRFLLGLPEGGVPYETRGGAALANRENRAHTHAFSGSVTIPSLDVALASGCCFNDTGAKGTFGYAGTTDPGSIDLPYISLLGCEKD